jgi:hypothetical protein
LLEANGSRGKRVDHFVNTLSIPFAFALLPFAHYDANERV